MKSWATTKIYSLYTDLHSTTYTMPYKIESEVNLLTDAIRMKNKVGEDQESSSTVQLILIVPIKHGRQLRISLLIKV